MSDKIPTTDNTSLTMFEDQFDNKVQIDENSRVDRIYITVTDLIRVHRKKLKFFSF